MSDLSISRRERRGRSAEAAKLYGIRGPQALDLHEAYAALAEERIPRALELAFPVSRTHPGNKHPWIILGGAALARREGETAAAFFGQAVLLAPGDATALTGLAKAHVLRADVEEAVATAERAFAAGAREPGLIGIYLDFMSRLGRRLHAADVLAPVLRQGRDAGLCLRLGDMLADADEPGRAAEFLERAWTLDPVPEAHRIARLRGLVYSVRLGEARDYAHQLLAEGVADRDAVVLQLINVLRVLRRPAEALDLADTHEFATPEALAQSRGLVASLLQDLDRPDEAEAAYLEGIHINGGSARVARAFGVFRFRAGDFGGGQPYYAQRLPELQRRRIPLENAAPHNLEGRTRVILMAEQGIGDQLALMPLVRLAPIDPARTELVMVGDPRFGPALEGNRLGLRHLPQPEFIANPQRIDPAEMVYLGDLTRYLAGADPAAMQGAYLVPDVNRVNALRSAYQARAAGRPVIGIAWRSNGLIGQLRSIALDWLVHALPEEALVVSLQYGPVEADIAAARRAQPGLEFLCDPAVDQMRDLAGFFAQIAAVDTVVSIDNTTVHACGALGHPDTHVLLPAGAECMWYWGCEGETDPWYGNLKLYRQPVPGNWGPALSGLSAALGQPAAQSPLVSRL